MAELDTAKMWVRVRGSSVTQPLAVLADSVGDRSPNLLSPPQLPTPAFYPSFLPQLPTPYLRVV